MGIIINSDIVSYYFNDFSYDSFSNYDNLDETAYPVSRPFERNLSIEEIFIRTHIICFPYKKIKLTTINSNQKEVVELAHSIFEIKQFDLRQNKLIKWSF